MAANELTEAEMGNRPVFLAHLVSQQKKVEQLEQQLAALQATSHGNANLVQELAGVKDRLNSQKAQPHPGGLCGDATCVDCVGTRSHYANLQKEAILANRKEIFAKLNQAAQLEDLIEPATLLHDRFVEIEKGTPGPQVINLPGGQRLVLA